MLHSLLHRRLGSEFSVAGEIVTPADALVAARAPGMDLVCLDADLVDEADQTSLAARIVLISAAPVVVLSAAAAAAAGSVLAASFLQTGARAVLHKPQGRLTLDLNRAFGDELVATLHQAVA